MQDLHVTTHRCICDVALMLESFFIPHACFSQFKLDQLARDSPFSAHPQTLGKSRFSPHKGNQELGPPKGLS